VGLTREQLMALDKQDLVEIVLRLEARLAALEARLNQNSKNSSKPPSSDAPFSKLLPKPAAGKKSGGQPGHEGHSLKKVAVPDRVMAHLPSRCAQCGYAFDPADTTGFSGSGVWQVFDLPAGLTIEVTEHRRLCARCPWCEQESAAPLPAWLSVETPCQFGPGCRALGVYLIQQQHLPYERTQAIFADLFERAPSEGTLFNWLREAAATLAPVESAIAEALVHSAQAGADETPVRGVGWLHTLVSEQFTWYGCHKKRGREAMDAFGLLPRFSGLLMSDCLSSYAIYGGRRSLCNAHLLRDLAAVSELSAGKHRWAAKMRALLLSVKERVESAGAPLARSAVLALWRRFGKIVVSGFRENEARFVDKSFALLSRLEVFREEYLRFATVAGAWFDNNISERALRMMKLHVKVSGCFRSSLGCPILCRVRGYLSTMRKQGQPLFAALRSVMERDPILPPLLQGVRN
jgi:transposase